jgi:hypothetical protein
MEYPDYLQPVLSRINPEYGVCISCDEGWWKLVSICDKELSLLDPQYTIFQIKEKFGGLRYYYNPSNPHNSESMDLVVRKYEKICSMTCEVTGGHGYLMRNGSRGMAQLKTLNESFLQQGWTKVDATDTVETNVTNLQK